MIWRTAGGREGEGNGTMSCLRKTQFIHFSFIFAPRREEIENLRNITFSGSYCYFSAESEGKAEMKGNINERYESSNR